MALERFEGNPHGGINTTQKLYKSLQRFLLKYKSTSILKAPRGAPKTHRNDLEGTSRGYKHHMKLYKSP